MIGPLKCKGFCEVGQMLERYARRAFERAPLLLTPLGTRPRVVVWLQRDNQSG